MNTNCMRYFASQIKFNIVDFLLKNPKAIHTKGRLLFYNVVFNFGSNIISDCFRIFIDNSKGIHNKCV